MIRRVRFDRIKLINAAPRITCFAATSLKVISRKLLRISRTFAAGLRSLFFLRHISFPTPDRNTGFILDRTFPRAFLFLFFTLVFIAASPKRTISLITQTILFLRATSSFQTRVPSARFSVACSSSFSLARSSGFSRPASCGRFLLPPNPRGAEVPPMRR
jgi:hypothetical protein